MFTCVYNMNLFILLIYFVSDHSILVIHILFVIDCTIPCQLLPSYTELWQRHTQDEYTHTHTHRIDTLNWRVETVNQRSLLPIPASILSAFESQRGYCTSILLLPDTLDNSEESKHNCIEHKKNYICGCMSTRPLNHAVQIKTSRALHHCNMEWPTVLCISPNLPSSSVQ